MNTNDTNDTPKFIAFDGIVDEAMPGTLFKIKLEGATIIATISGKMRKNRIRILPGDKVKCEVSPYDLTRGRIVYRY